MTTRRYCPDPILEHLTWTTTPPLDADLRADVVRLACSRFALARGYGRLACVLYSADLDALKELILALGDSPMSDSPTCLEASHYQRALKEIAVAWQDETLVRLASIAGDILDWDAVEFSGPSSDGWKRYVCPAWLVLCDEIEFERDARLEACEDASWWNWRPCGYSRNEARAAAKSDRRRWPERR